MLSIRSTDALSLRSDPEIAVAVDLERQIASVDKAIAPLLKLKKKLAKVEEELANANFLIDSGIGSKSDQKALRKSKKDIRQRRVALRSQLEVLPGLQEERRDLAHQLDVLRRRYGLL